MKTIPSHSQVLAGTRTFPRLDTEPSLDENCLDFMLEVREFFNRVGSNSSVIDVGVFQHSLKDSWLKVGNLK